MTVNNTLTTALTAICRGFLQDAAAAVVAEPYIPYVPESWNRVLVLAEAQNLSARNKEYVNRLVDLNRESRYRRLGYWPDGIGIQPWDDGTLKLAVEAALQLHAEETAVSNAVLWSTISDRQTNENPGAELRAKSVHFWSAALAVLKPEVIVTAGAVAREVVAAAIGHANQPRRLAWVLPSPRVMAPVAGMVIVEDLRQRFPEVDRVLQSPPAWMVKPPEPRQVLYACLAVGASKASTPLQRTTAGMARTGRSLRSSARRAGGG